MHALVFIFNLKGREREIVHLLLYYANIHNSQGGPGQSQEQGAQARCPVVAGTPELEPSPAAYQSNNRKLELKVQAVLKPRYMDMG